MGTNFDIYACFFQIDMAENDEELHMALTIDESQGLLLEAGFRKPISLLKLNDKPIIRGVLLDYHLMMKVKMHMDQFAEGLNQLKLLDNIRAHPLLFKSLLVYSENKMTAGIIFKIQSHTQYNIFFHCGGA